MINVAVVGAGNISPSHMRGYLAFPNRCRIVALCDVVPARAEAKKRDLGLEDVDVVDSHEKLLGRDDIDLVSVCTPPSSHAPVTIDLLRAAAIIASHSVSDGAIGFSTTTFLPARSRSIVTGAWLDGGVQTLTRSMSSRPSSLSCESTTSTSSRPRSRVFASALAGTTSHSATMRQRFGNAR